LDLYIQFEIIIYITIHHSPFTIHYSLFTIHYSLLCGKIFLIWFFGRMPSALLSWWLKEQTVGTSHAAYRKTAFITSKTYFSFRDIFSRTRSSGKHAPNTTDCHSSPLHALERRGTKSRLQTEV
jgi:hypothetical protein